MRSLLIQSTLTGVDELLVSGCDVVAGGRGADRRDRAALNLAASEEAGGNISRFNTEMEQMAAKGVNNLRIASPCTPAPHTYVTADHGFPTL